MPEPPETLSPTAQARVAAVQSRASATASTQAALPAADEQVEDARQAVTTPVEERAARAQSALVEALGQQPEPSPEIEALCERIREVIRNKRPPDEDSLVEAQPEEMAREAGSEVGQGVQGEVNNVQGSYEGMQQEPAPTEAAPREELPPPPEAAAAAPIQATQATPEPVPAENTSLEADVAANRQRMDQAGMSSEPAQLVQTGPVAEARRAQGELEQTAAEEPAQVQARQAAALNAARGDMAQLQESALEALRSSRSRTTSGARAQQGSMVGSEEQMRAQASSRSQAIFDEAQRRVDALLQPLSDTAMRRWDTGIERLSNEFKSSLRRVAEYIEERHSGVLGTLVSGADYLFGLPRWITQEYDRAEQAFGDGACDLARDISREVNGVIATCEALIEQARADIAQVFSQLPASLQEWAATEQARLGQSLDGLRDNARRQRDQFNQQLVQRASQAVQEVRQEIHGLRQRARGLVGRIADAVNAFLQDPARFIIEGLLSLLGIQPSAFWAVVARIRQVISDIADDPLGFAGKLLSAVGDGFKLFFDNVGSHLLRGLIEWLFAGLAGVGVQIPRDLSLKSIITFFLQLMGISWERIRRLLARRIGERNVALLERAWSLISTLIQQGPAGIFEMIKDRLNPREILDQVLTAARDALIEMVITRVTARILMLFNPVGAILQAIEAIYRVLKWLFQNAARIFSLIETVVNGIADILRGNTAGMARAVEQALARLISPVIAFLADYLGLGGLPDRIRGTIERLQGWVEGILDRVIGWLISQGQRLLRAVGLGREQRPGAGAAAGDTELGETVRFRAEGESHRMWVDVQGGRATLMIASTEMTLAQRLENWQSRLGTLPEQKPPEDTSPGDPPRRRAANLLQQADIRLRSADQLADGLAEQRRTTAANPAAAPATPLDDNVLEQQEHDLAAVVSELFELFGDRPRLSARFQRELTRVHRSINDQVVRSLPTLEQETAGTAIPNWGALQGHLRTRSPAAQALSNPLTQDDKNPFGKYAHTHQAMPQLRLAIEEAQRRPNPPPGVPSEDVAPEDWLKPRKRSLNEAKAPYAQAKDTLANEVFDGSHEPTANAALKAAFLTAFEEAPPPADPRLQAAFPSPATTVNRLITIIRGGTVGAVNLALLKTLCYDREAGVTNRTFLAGRLRDATSDMHEWIPVSRVMDMVERDVASAVEGLVNPCRWIKLQHHLRTDTEHLIYKPSMSSRPLSYLNAPYTVLQGHVGSTRLDMPGALRSEQAGNFHSALFDVVDTAMRENATVEQVIARLKAKCEEWIWDGTPPDPPIHPRQVLWSGENISARLPAVSRLQRMRLSRMLRDFDNALAAVDRS
ncbi:MAG: hypothetical protein JXB05_33025 [Myxococcaceae bacterium]|nr:hypothetical protein [Myxococcaceae bacterium]